jgi:hypothetical protein
MPTTQRSLPTADGDAPLLYQKPYFIDESVDKA